MNRDAVADIFQRIGRAKAGSREKEPGAGPSAKTVKQHNETPVLVHEPTSESATEAKEAGVYICTECGAAMRPDIGKQDLPLVLFHPHPPPQGGPKAPALIQ